MNSGEILSNEAGNTFRDENQLEAELNTRLKAKGVLPEGMWVESHSPMVESPEELLIRKEREEGGI